MILLLLLSSNIEDKTEIDSIIILQFFLSIINDLLKM